MLSGFISFSFFFSFAKWMKLHFVNSNDAVQRCNSVITNSLTKT